MGIKVIPLGIKFLYSLIIVNKILIKYNYSKTVLKCPSQIDILRSCVTMLITVSSSIH